VSDPALLAELVLANRILFRQGAVDGFGHISVRDTANPERYLLARSMAPALVEADDIMLFDLDSNPLDQRGRRMYLERFIHGQIYKRRPDVQSIVHSHSASVIPFANTDILLRPMNHIAGFLGTGAPVFDIGDVAGPATDMLIRDNMLGEALASALGAHQVALMRGHGSIAVGQSIPHAVYRAIYTETNARIQAQALAMGGVPKFLSADEAAAAMRTNDSVVERPWSLWASEAQKQW
jgi:HCOMODA/2-hydroxy-3-carboxy-muconic semialdehyde decarboxylase